MHRTSVEKAHLGGASGMVSYAKEGSKGEIPIASQAVPRFVFALSSKFIALPFLENLNKYVQSSVDLQFGGYKKQPEVTPQLLLV